MAKNLLTLIDDCKNGAIAFGDVERIITLLINDKEQTDRDLTKLITERDHWEEKATELANDIGAALGFEVGEHSSTNCPVQEAIDGVYHMRSQIDEWKKI